MFDKQIIISEALKSDEGQKKLAESMAPAIKRSLEWQAMVVRHDPLYKSAMSDLYVELGDLALFYTRFRTKQIHGYGVITKISKRSVVIKIDFMCRDNSRDDKLKEQFGKKTIRIPKSHKPGWPGRRYQIIREGDPIFD